LQEANKVAAELKLPEKLPLTQTNSGTWVGPFGDNYATKRIGNVSTENYVYCVSEGNKLSYVIGRHQYEDCRNYLATNTLPESQMDTNSAYQMATQWLEAISVDVNALNRNCSVVARVDHTYFLDPPGQFVPLYDVVWSEPQHQGSAASVFLFAPTKTLLQLRVEDPKYILRPPLVFTNLADLLIGPDSGVTREYLDKFKQYLPRLPPTNLMMAIASADRIVITNEPMAHISVGTDLATGVRETNYTAAAAPQFEGFSQTLQGPDVGPVVRAISSAKYTPDAMPVFFTGWDWKMYLYQGTNLLEFISFQNKYLRMQQEYCDDSGVVEKYFDSVTQEAERWRTNSTALRALPK
jgi:hypothetical protein